ncbi:MAG TPA: DUF6152 family protein [Gammaproteobacteria bacterium]
MNARGLVAVVAGGLLLAAGGASAHHSFSAEFDAEKPITLTGIVTKVDWTNPHVWIWLNVKDEATGEMVNWGAEMGPPHGLQRNGWRRDTLKIGEEIRVDGFLARNGSKRVNARTVTLTATGSRPSETLDAASSSRTGN